MDTSGVSLVLKHWNHIGGNKDKGVIPLILDQGCRSTMAGQCYHRLKMVHSTHFSLTIWRACLVNLSRRQIFWRQTVFFANLLATNRVFCNMSQALSDVAVFRFSQQCSQRVTRSVVYSLKRYEEKQTLKRKRCLLVCLMQLRKRRSSRFWVHPIIAARNTYGHFFFLDI